MDGMDRSWEENVYRHMDSPYCTLPCLLVLYGGREGGILSVDLCENGVEGLAAALDARRDKKWYREVTFAKVMSYRDGIVAERELEKILYRNKVSYTRFRRGRREFVESRIVEGSLPWVTEEKPVWVSATRYV